MLAELVVRRQTWARLFRPSFRFLVHDPRFVYSRPCTSPSGDHVVYMRAPATDDPGAAENSNFSPWELWTVPTAGGAPSLLFSDPNVRATRPDWSGTTNRIAFTGVTDRGATLWLLDPENGRMRQIPLGEPYRDELHYPTWYPDGERIALTDYRSRTLLEVWPDRQRVRPLTRPDRIWAGMASVAPDQGTMPRIAFAGQRPNVSYSTSNNRIWIRSPDGTLHLLDPQHGRTPSWSPLGDRLAFSSIRPRAHPAPVMWRRMLPQAAVGIYVRRVGLNGRALGAPRLISPPDHAAIHPKWHPSGRMLVCTMHSLVSGRRGVVLLQLEP